MTAKIIYLNKIRKEKSKEKESEERKSAIQRLLKEAEKLRW